MTTDDRLKVLACRVAMAMALTQAQRQQLGSQRQLGVHRWLVADVAPHDKPVNELATMYLKQCLVYREETDGSINKRRNQFRYCI
jgi:hypothetical protein